MKNLLKCFHVFRYDQDKRQIIYAPTQEELDAHIQAKSPWKVESYLTTDEAVEKDKLIWRGLNNKPIIND